MISKAPSFKNLHPASEAASRAKRANRHSDTEHELLLRQELWRMGLRYRKNVQSLPGKPDIVFARAKVVVFCDGDFWHGRNWSELSSKLRNGSNPAYWLAKIESNIERDKRNSTLLENAGWIVIRVWETDIKQNATEVARQIAEIIERQTAVQQSHNQQMQEAKVN